MASVSKMGVLLLQVGIFVSVGRSMGRSGDSGLMRDPLSFVVSTRFDVSICGVKEISSN